MRKLTVAAAALLLFGRCAKPDQADTDCIFPANEKELTVVLNNCGEAAAQALPAVCLEAVNDSRCPEKSICAWQGVAVANFSFAQAGLTYRFALSTLTSPAFPPTDTVVAGRRFRLVDVLPHPGSGAPGPARALLRIGH